MRRDKTERISHQKLAGDIWEKHNSSMHRRRKDMIFVATEYGEEGEKSVHIEADSFEHAESICEERGMSLSGKLIAEVFDAETANMFFLQMAEESRDVTQ